MKESRAQKISQSQQGEQDCHGVGLMGRWNGTEREGRQRGRYGGGRVERETIKVTNMII